MVNAGRFDWYLEREAARGKPSWHDDDRRLVADIVEACENGEIPCDAVIDPEDGTLRWYGWSKDANGPAEVWSLVKYD